MLLTLAFFLISASKTMANPLFDEMIKRALQSDPTMAKVVDPAPRTMPMAADSHPMRDTIMALGVPKAMDMYTTHMRQGIKQGSGQPVFPEAGFGAGGSHFQNPVAIDAVQAGMGALQTLLATKLLKNHPELAKAFTSSVANGHLGAAQNNTDEIAEVQPLLDRRAKLGTAPKK